MAAQDELGQLRQQMHELRLLDKGRPEALKEIVRQLELRLAAQLQEKLALENRMYGLIPWIVVLFLGSFAYEGLRQPGLQVSRLVFIGSLGFASLAAMLLPADVNHRMRSWCYAGSGLTSSATEDDALRSAIGRYVEGVDGNERVLRRLRYANIAPLVIIAFGWMFMLTVLGDPPARPK